MDRALIINRFQTDEERLQVSKMLDLVIAVKKQLTSAFSDFYDPVSLSKYIDVIKRHKPAGMNISLFGGHDECERKIACFSMEDELIEFPIICMEISYNLKFSKILSHRDFLGSVLGLGLNRTKIGDIFVPAEAEDMVYIYVKSEVADYILYNLDRVGKTKVSVKISSKKAVEIIDKQEDITRITVSSMRLDSVLAAGFHLSRGKAAALIEGEKVFVNWKTASNGSKQVSKGDTITLRGTGRLKITDILGKSKKDRLVLEIEKHT